MAEDSSSRPPCLESVAAYGDAPLTEAAATVMSLGFASRLGQPEPSVSDQEIKQTVAAQIPETESLGTFDAPPELQLIWRITDEAIQLLGLNGLVHHLYRGEPGRTLFLTRRGQAALERGDPAPSLTLVP